LFAEARTLTLDKLKYAFESWWQTPAIAGGVFLQLIKIVMRDEGSKVGY
jgi:hypothetical protein